jgi:hypothetical protein
MKAGFCVNGRDYTVDWCLTQPNKLFVFGDNALRRGKSGQAQIRDIRNAFGIITKLKPSYDASAYFSDNDLVKFKRLIDNDFMRLEKQFDSFQWIVFPKHGIGTGLSQLPTKAPQCFAYLCQKIQLVTGLTMNEKGFQ